MSEVRAVLPHLQSFRDDKLITSMISTRPDGFLITNLGEDGHLTTIRGRVEDGQLVIIQNTKEDVLP